MPSTQPSNRCWGWQVQNKDTHDCVPRFCPGRRHFKTKFCGVCRKRILVSETRVRALTTTQERMFYNTRATGMWSTAPTALGHGNYRIINNTVGCTPPSLVLFEDQPPDLAWHPMPIDWKVPNGLVELRVARGTLVPPAPLRVPPVLCKVLVPSVAPMRLKTEPNNPEEPPVVATRAEDAQAEQTEQAEQAESLDHPFLAALGTFDDDDDNKRGGARFNDDNGDEDDENGDDDDYEWMSDAVARKKALRMKRNRQSAATSRDRKRRYIHDLEQQVYELTATVKTLREENSLLSLLNLQPVQNALDDRSSPVSIDADLLGACDVAFL